MHQDDELRIDTPEQVALAMPLAGIGSRFLALALDTLLQVAIFVGLFLVLLFAAALRANLLTGCVAPVLMLVGSFLLYWGYFAWFEAVWRGQTPGKRYARIRVIKDSGRPINAFEAITRNFIRVVDFLPGMYGVGVVCMLLNARNRRLGDFAAGTVVVHEQVEDRATPYVEAAPTKLSVPEDVARAAREDLLLVETYLQRRYDLDPEVRVNMARDIAARVRAKAGLADDPSQAPDDFLEAVARRIRESARF